MANVGYGDTGIDASGASAGGTFADADGSSQASIGSGSFGVDATGETVGGRFTNALGGAETTLANNYVGVDATGDLVGGYFSNLTGSAAYASLAAGTMGIYASSNGPAAEFNDQNSSGHAYIANGDYGVQGYGSFAGAYFQCNGAGNTGEVWLGDHDRGVWSRGSEYGGYFRDIDTSSYGQVGYSTYKIFGSGTVSFVQNHPEDASKVVVYQRPRGLGGFGLHAGQRASRGGACRCAARRDVRLGGQSRRRSDRTPHPSGGLLPRARRGGLDRQADRRHRGRGV